MRIGIDLTCLPDDARGYTGISNYTRHLTRALLALKTDHEFVFLKPPRKAIPFWSWHGSYARMMEKEKLDLLHGPANVVPWFYSPHPTLSPKGRGKKGEGRIFITIHDLAIYKHPEWFPSGQWFATKLLVPRSIKKAAKIIVPSQTTKRDLQELFGVTDEKIAVIPLGVEERFFKNPNDQTRMSNQILNPNTQKYILFVGTLEPRKNIRGAILAYEALPMDIRKEYQFWIAGLDSGHLKLDIPDGVRALGYVPDQDLPALYQNASVFVYPSLYEGFGLPVLEAMAAGVPVVTSKGTAMEEVAGGFVELVDPNDSGEIAKAIAKYLSPREYPGSLSSSGESNNVASPERDGAYASQISELAQARARNFTWKKVAEETIQTYESV